MKLVRLHDGREVPSDSEEWRRLLQSVAMIPIAGCWLWTGAIKDNGYGDMWFRGRVVGAHRAAFTLQFGEIPKGMHVCHTCDVPCCVNPAHLFLGTHRDNMRDASRKGRLGHRTAKLTFAQAEEIRSSASRGVDLARLYGVTENVICNIRAGRHYRRPHALGKAA